MTSDGLIQLDNHTLTGHVVDVIGRRIYGGEIVIRNGKIKAINPCNVEESAPYYLPGFIDAHVHIESSMMMPTEFAAMVRKNGTVGAVCDPHEIANILGIKGIELMMENARNSAFHFKFTAPSCVPCCGGYMETAGATLDSSTVAALMQRDEICALAEMMNFPGVLSGDKEVMAKIAAAKAAGKPVDGHAPGLVGEDRRKYADAGISTDHECSTMEEAMDAVAAGMHILIREGSAAKNYTALADLLAKAPQNVMFSTDDAHPTDLKESHIDRHVRMAIHDGYDFMDIICAASLNPVKHYKIDCGLLQVGDSADLIAISDTSADFRVLETYICGRASSEIDDSCTMPVEEWMSACKASPVTAKDLAQVAPSHMLHQIEACDRSLLTGHYVGPIDSESQKMVVYNRYEEGKKPSIGYIRGFGLKKGAWAQTIAHDCHNIIAIGTDDELIAGVINRLIEIGGGIVATDGTSTGELALPIAGLISPEKGEILAEKNIALENIVRNAGCKMGSAFITLAFMALPVIPDLKLTDKGLFDAKTWSMID